MQEHLSIQDQGSLRVADVVGGFQGAVRAHGDVVSAEGIQATSLEYALDHIPRARERVAGACNVQVAREVGRVLVELDAAIAGQPGVDLVRTIPAGGAVNVDGRVGQNVHPTGDD